MRGTDARVEPLAGGVSVDDLFEAQRWAVDTFLWYRAISNLGAALRAFHEPHKLKRPAWLTAESVPSLIAAHWQDIKSFPDELHERCDRWFTTEVQRVIQRGNLGVSDPNVFALGEEMPTCHHVAVKALSIGVAVLYGLHEIWAQQHPGIEPPPNNWIGLFPDDLIDQRNSVVLIKFAREIPQLNVRDLCSKVREESSAASQWIRERQAGAVVDECTDSVRPLCVNARMLDLLTRRPETQEWTQRKFADHFECSPSTIANTAAWRELIKTREMNRLDRLARQRPV